MLPPSSHIVDQKLTLMLKQRMVLMSCKKFLEQIKEKGIGLTFAERTACNLLLDCIERLDNS